jgi:tetratricopeptide (TPR) repeat protein
MLRKFFMLILLSAALAAAHAKSVDVINVKGAEARAALESFQGRLKSNPDDVEALKSAGILLHQMARAKPNKTQVEQGEAYLKKAVQLDPKDVQTTAWLGSITTMKALFETDPGKQTFFVKVGSRAMDQAVQRDPDNLVVRLIRANNSMELPPFLKRTQFAVEDYGRYLALCQRQSCARGEVDEAKQKLAAAQKIVKDNAI